MVAIIDDDGQLFGLVNIVDLFVVLLAVALVAAGFALIADDDDTANSTAIITFESEPTQPYVAAAIQNGPVDGPELVAVRTKSVEPATIAVPDQNGELHLREHPRLRSVTLTLELEVTRTGGGFLYTDAAYNSDGQLVPRQRPLSIGERVRFRIDNVRIVGNVTAIRSTT